MKVLFAGEGGQGVQAAAEILAQAAFLENKHVLYIPNFGVEQRGGVSLAFVTIDQKSVVYPKFEKADFLIVLSDRARERVKTHLGLKTQVIAKPKSTLPSQVWNIVALGKLNRLGKIVKKENLIKALDKRFARQFKEKPELRKLDLEALEE